ncbi:MAG: DUF6283 family protein [Aliihoeflea sp.]|uniref:DUF6283 family protein n=1 Tax=Aliihoeflea sp. TaxID=2608088 RepID=UPI004033F809
MTARRQFLQDGVAGDAEVSGDASEAAPRFAVRRTCGECPWLRATPVGRFPVERFVELASTADQGFNGVFACHKSPDGREQACAGYLLAAGMNNWSVRLAAIRGRLDMSEISATGPLYDSYAEMLMANLAGRKTK